MLFYSTRFVLTIQNILTAGLIDFNKYLFNIILYSMYFVVAGIFKTCIICCRKLDP